MLTWFQVGCIFRGLMGKGAFEESDYGTPPGEDAYYITKEEQDYWEVWAGWDAHRDCEG